VENRYHANHPSGPGRHRLEPDTPFLFDNARTAFRANKNRASAGHYLNTNSRSKSATTPSGTPFKRWLIGSAKPSEDNHQSDATSSAWDNTFRQPHVALVSQPCPLAMLADFVLAASDAEVAPSVSIEQA